MTLYAILSDIHGNYPALLAVARDARALARQAGAGPVEFICLGDVADYGPQPNQCVAWVRQHAAVTVQGNHDRVVAAPHDYPPMEIEHKLWPIVLWTRTVLREAHKQALRQWREQRGGSALLAGFAAFHSDPDESDAYIDNPRIAGRVLRQLSTPYGLFGHTHVQGAYILDDDEVHAVFAWPAEPLPRPVRTGVRLLPTNTWFLLPDHGRRMILNPGSVGQPRQHVRAAGILAPRDNRAAYLVLRQNAAGQWQARFQRVTYPVEQTVQRMREQICWPPPEHDRYRPLTNGSIDAPSHPFAAQLHTTLATMETSLPALVELLIEQLLPPQEAAR